MGAKITIDSATLMNKGLEVIEAHHLFDLPYDRIEVMVHPQSLVHAMVRLDDGSVLAHCGPPDMRVPIGYALRHPAAAARPASRWTWWAGRSTSRRPTRRRSPAWRCARAGGHAGGTAPGGAERGQRGGGGGLPGRADRLHGHPARRRATRSTACPAGPADTLDAVVRGRRPRPRGGRRRPIEAVPA